MDLCILVYRVAKSLPEEERFGLSAQLRRAAVSVPSNIAEGQSWGEDGRYIHHLRIALGSLGEVSTDIEIAGRLLMLPAPLLRETGQQVARTGQVLHGLLRARRKKRLAGMTQRR